jgi:hypothetical protein
VIATPSIAAIDNCLLVGNPNDVGEAAVQTTMKPSHRSPGGAPTLPGMPRLTGQRIVLGTDHAECTVFGRRHRRPVEQTVSLAVALDLARRGLATVVRTSGD